MAADAIVIGAGVIGLAAGLELTRAGHRVRVLTADVPGSRQSAGLSRIFRLAHGDAGLTQAAARSRELWQEWEELAGSSLLDRVGLLLTGDMSDREVHLGPYGGLERLSGAAHPLAIAEDRWALEATGAAIHAEDTVRFLQGGLELVLAEAASVEARSVKLTDGRRLEAERVVVCAGPETYGLIGLPEPRRARSVRFSFALREPLDAPAPCWINRAQYLGEPFYAVMDGTDHYSIGLSEQAAAEVPPGEHVRDVYRRVTEIVRRLFPRLEAVAERVITCEYPINPRASGAVHDGWQLVHHQGVLGLTGPNLFKFAPLLGRLIAEKVSSAARQ